ncbi:MAG: S1C family serine protease [Patescibacteria group bacterium]
MNLEELNKTQIILLTLLTSFVTSIATGIVTVSLVNQAPPVVTDTIHKVVEKTVERVVPGEQKATVIENNTTVVVSDEDFIMEAIDKNSQSLVRIYKKIPVTEEPKVSLFQDNKTPLPKETTENKFVTFGLIISSDGKMIADSDKFISYDKDNKPLTSTETYYFQYNNQEIILVLEMNTDNNLILLAPKDKIEKIEFDPIVFGDSDSLKLGQTVVALGGEKTNIVLTGIISNLTRDKIILPKTKESDEEKTKIINTQIDTNIDPQASMKLLINLDGEVIGLKSKENYYIPVNSFKDKLVSVDKTISNK